MESHDLICFCRVYEEKGINKAARQLYISSQGLSRIITRLETELEVQLFQRNKQGMEATVYADFLYEKAQTLIMELEQLQHGIQQLKDSSMEVRIGFATGALTALNVLGLQELQKQLPHVRLQFLEDENKNIQSRLLRGELDIGFLIGTVSSAQFEAIKVVENQLEVLVYEGHPWYDRTSVSCAELKDQPLISLNENYHSYHSLLQRTADLGFSPRIVFQVMEPSMIARLTAEHIGLGIDVNMHKETPVGVRRIPLEDSISWNVYCVCHVDKVKNETISQIRSLICSQ